MIRKLLIAASAFSLIAMPSVAQATERHASPVGAKDQIAGMSTVGLLLALAVVAAFGVIVASDNNNHPVSP